MNFSDPIHLNVSIEIVVEIEEDSRLEKLFD
jgi:hypothetical protein